MGNVPNDPFDSGIVDNRGFLETEFQLDNQNIHFVSVSTNPLRKDDFKHPIYIKKWNLEIPCVNLVSEFEFYRKLGTPKAFAKAKLIEEYLAKT